MPDEFEEVHVAHGGKRCAIVWDTWIGDWFASQSPRNGNSNAEGPWDHWVDLAIAILQDPLTEKVRPEARAAVAQLGRKNFYDESGVELTDEDLMARFKGATDAA